MTLGVDLCDAAVYIPAFIQLSPGLDGKFTCVAERLTLQEMPENNHC